MRWLATVVALLCVLMHAPSAWAHASLVHAQPADGATLSEAPSELTLTFNEPVSPLVMRLVGPDGEVATPAFSAENDTVRIIAPALSTGTHVLSWRVISADGHPVGGSIVFSVGAPSGAWNTAPLDAGDPMVRRVFWVAKVLIYLGLFLGVGGAFFHAWLRGEDEKAVGSWTVAILLVGLITTPLSVGLQGLDALALPLSGLTQASCWMTGVRTSYGATAAVGACAMLAAVLTFFFTSPGVARGFSLAGLVCVGLALTLSGHAGTVEPRLLTRTSVFLHGVCVALWVGALLPLAVTLRTAGPRLALARFSRMIPLPLAILVLTGTLLAFVQLDRVDALWTTAYGLVLSCKLMLVFALFALAGMNRYVWVPKLNDGSPATSHALARSIALEIVIACAILGLVALWRFTPPPRALAAVEPVSVHLHGERAMAQIEITPIRARGARLDALVLDGEFRPLSVKEVSLVISNAAAGIEPVRRELSGGVDGSWRIDGLRIPIAGRWHVRLEILINDFEMVPLEDEVQLPRAP